MACFDGHYPIEIPDVVGKHVLEGIERGVEKVEHAAGYAAEDALTRP
jgi:amidophosphoribosyltransferase